MPTRKRITTASPYENRFGFCRAIRHGNVIHVAGTAPIGPDGNTVGVGDPATQARRCFEIMIAAIEELRGSASDVVRTRMFLTRIGDWETVGQVHGEYFADVKPVATMVAVSALIDPDWLVEFEAEALVQPTDLLEEDLGE